MNSDCYLNDFSLELAEQPRGRKPFVVDDEEFEMTSIIGHFNDDLRRSLVVNMTRRRRLSYVNRPEVDN